MNQNNEENEMSENNEKTSGQDEVAKLQGVVRSLMRELEPFCDGGSRRDEVMDAAREALGEKKEPKKVFVHAVVRYPEDAEVNGQDEDNDNPKMPMLAFEGIEYGMKKWVWHIAIDAKSGKIDDWPEGVTASTHYKVCDRCKVDIKGVPPYDEYVPDFLAIDDNGYGDYIMLTINGDGTIKGWDEKRVWEWVREFKRALREDG